MPGFIGCLQALEVNNILCLYLLAAVPGIIGCLQALEINNILCLYLLAAVPGIIGCLQALEVNMFVFVGCSAWNHRLSASLGSEYVCICWLQCLES